MVEILREQTRQIAPDKSKAIQLQNTAQTLQDIGQVANVAKNVRGILSQEDVQKAKNLSIEDNAKLQAEISKSLSDPNFKYTPEFDAAIREKSKSIREARMKTFGDMWSEGVEAYNQQMDTAESQGIASAIKFSEQQKAVAAQNGVDEYTGLKDQLTSAFTGAILSGQAHKISDIEDSFNKKADEIHKKSGSLLPLDTWKLNAVKEAKSKSLAAAAANEQSEYTYKVLNDDDMYKSYMGQSYIDGIVAEATKAKTYNLESQLSIQKEELANKKSIRNISYPTEEKNIKKLENEIKSLQDEEKNKDYVNKIVSEDRENLKKDIEPAVKMLSGYKKLEQNKINSMQMKETLFSGISNMNYSDIKSVTQNENFKDLLAQSFEVAELEKTGIESIDKIDAAKEQKMKMVAEKMNDLNNVFLAYQDKITNVSLIPYSTPEAKALTGGIVNEFMSRVAKNESPNGFDVATEGLKVLSQIADLPLTESERRTAHDFISSIIGGNDQNIKTARDLIGSKDTAIYQGGGLAGVAGTQVTKEGTPIVYGDEAGTGGIDITGKISKSAGTRLYENKESALSSFDRAMRRANQEWTLMGMAAINSGQVSQQQLQSMRKEFINQKINDWYDNRYAIDLRVLDEKLEAKRPAYQELDGVVYEYIGRDSQSRPLWKDHSVLNTNESISRLYKSARMGSQQNKKDNLE